jgi:hypothetical protein
MRCLNHCPQKAIEAAHGMATLFIILITSVNTWLILTLADYLNIRPDAWWWKITNQIIAAAVTVFCAAFLYIIMHYLIGLKPVNYLIRFTSLTSLPFWRRYKYLKNKKVLDNNPTESNSKTNTI